MNTYTTKQIDALIERYLMKGGEVTQLDEGVLGHGSLALHGAGLKTAIVKEVNLSEWSSAHTVRMYNETPKKYKNLI